jgi:hypothetical protein
MISAAMTIASATHDHQRTLRPNIRSTIGAMISTSPRMISWMNGIETPSKVKDSGTVNSTSAVPMPDRKVIQVGHGTLNPPIFTALASRCQPDSQMNR